MAYLKTWKSLAMELKDKDPILAPIIHQVGDPKIQFEKDAFRALTQSILSQQLASRAAQAIINRFEALKPPFPQPKQVVLMRATTLRKIGISGSKAKYLKELSKRWRDPKWQGNWNKLSDELLTERLIEVPGIGEWTAHMFLIFSLGRTDILPIGDYGIRRGVGILYNQSKLPTPKEVKALVPHWQGKASVASWYVWQGLDKKLIS